jgi:pSer/pThr/pTyr-binding forkhead associated (FHA) protein
MRRDKDTFDPTQPALLVTYGNTAKKYRHLDSDLIVLGRSSVCDFSLVSPEVAPVHCLLVRVKQGWRLRDCSGRPGTRVNGKVVQECLLDDGDMVQVGAFSFQVHLPAGHTPQQPSPPPVPPTLVNKLQRSRRRLAERALKFREQLGDRFKAVEQADVRLSSERADLNKQGESLRVHQREYELRMKRLELSERDLATDRATLEREYQGLQEEIERHSAAVRQFTEDSERKERELEEKEARVKAELEQLWDEWREHSTTPAPEPQPVAEEETARVLELRARELDHYARHLRKCKQPGVSSDPIPDPLRQQREEMSHLLAELRDLLREANEFGRRACDHEEQYINGNSHALR